MNIPTTIADVRANVAVCDGTTTFYAGEECNCLVTSPLNRERPSRYAFYPGSGRLMTLYPIAEDGFYLPDAIADLANDWDHAFPSGLPVTREQCLAFIDEYTAKEDQR